VTGRRTPLAEEDVVIGTVRMRESGPTPYTRLGDWLQLAGVAALVVAAGASAGRPGQGG
jgi:apolipoprotein N-acyltransferase